MKKFLLLFLLSGFVCTSFAQSVHFGIRAGLNESGLSENIALADNAGNPIKPSVTYISRFHAGLFAEIAMGQFAIQPGVFYTQKGGKISGHFADNTTTQDYNEKTTLNYLEIPVNVLYNIPVGVGKIFVGGGPYAAFGLSGHYQSYYRTTQGLNTQTGAAQSDVRFGKNGLRNPDYGINTLLGLCLKNNLSFNVGYGFGLTNLYRSDSSSKNKVFSVSVGYEFL